LAATVVRDETTGPSRTFAAVEGDGVGMLAEGDHSADGAPWADAVIAPALRTG
jgi:hypothetical protein